MERKNWAENVTINPSRIVTPTSVEEIVTTIQEAEREGQQVRAIGSGWSFTDVMYTNDVLVDTSRLNRLLALSQGRTGFRDESPILTNALRDEILSSTRQFAHVQSGITIKTLYEILDKRDRHPGDSERSRWALITQGGAGGQTIAGVISTSTHGANFSRPPIADGVRAIHLIGPGGIHHWIEPAAPQNLTDLTRLLRSMPDLRRENVHYDDDWFNTALVSMGCLGIIVSLVVEVTNQYGLSQRVKQTRWREVRRLLEVPTAFETGIFSPSFPLGIRHPNTAAGRSVNSVPSGVEIFLNPYRISDDYSRDRAPDRHCILVSRAEARPVDEGAFDEAPTRSNDHFHDFWRDFGNALKAAWTVIRVESGGPGTVKDEINGIMNSSRSDTTGYPVGYSVLDTYDYGGAKPPVMSMEIAISIANNQHVLLIDRLLEIFDDLIRRGQGRKLIGAMSIRFTMPSRAFLAMQNQGAAIGRDRICHIEVFGLKELDAGGSIVHDGNMEGRTDEFIFAFEETVHSFGGRLHWGQLNLLDRARIERAYPETLHRWRKIRTEIISTGKSKTFSNWFSQRCGLEAYTEVLAGTSWGPNRYDIFGFNERGEVLQLWWAPGWTWSNLGNNFPSGDQFVGPLTATSWGTNRIDVFGLGKSGNVLQLWWNGRWNWSNLGNGFSDRGFIGPLTANSWGEGRYDIFGLDSIGHVRQLWFDRGWHWSNLENGFLDGERFFGPLAATSWGTNRIDVFGIGKSGNVLQLWWDGSWHWSNLGNGFPNGDRFVGPLTVVSWGTNRIDVFGIGKSGNVLQLWWDGSWHWSNLGNSFSSEVTKRLGPPHSYRASVGEPYQLWKRERERDRFAGPITANSWSEGRIDIFGFGESGNVLQLWFERNWNWSNLGRMI